MNCPKQEVVLPAVAYCFLSSLMSIVNKYALTVFPYATALVFFQYSFSFIMVGSASLLGVTSINKLHTYQLWNMLPLATSFHLCIWTGSKVILHGNVDTFIAFRSLAPAIISVFDSFRTGSYPTFAELTTLLAIGSSGCCFALLDDKFTLRAYAWGFLFLCENFCMT